MNVLIFDIETIPDLETGRVLNNLQGVDDNETALAMTTKRYQETQGRTDFLKHYLHRIVAISLVLRQGDNLTVWSLGDLESSESELIERFYDGLERYIPTLVSWNGNGFDLPVLHYRALKHGITAAKYWDNGDDDRSFKYNNYMSRYHWRHIDLMDVLAGFDGRAIAPLNDICKLLGFPGKLDMDGGAVWEQYQAGDLEGIRNYCETDVLNTYLVYLRFELMRGHLMPDAYESEIDKVKQLLQDESKPHFGEFLHAWDDAS